MQSTTSFDSNLARAVRRHATECEKFLALAQKYPEHRVLLLASAARRSAQAFAVVAKPRGIIGLPRA